VILALDTQNQLRGFKLVATGGQNNTIGRPTPSAQDVRLTADLVKAGELLSIKVHEPHHLRRPVRVDGGEGAIARTRLQCPSCTDWQARPSRRFPGITLYRCPGSGLMLPGLWPPEAGQEGKAAVRKMDVIVKDERTVVLFTHVSDVAQEWFEQNVVAERWQWRGRSRWPTTSRLNSCSTRSLGMWAASAGGL
jgi:hypothetical protein